MSEASLRPRLLASAGGALIALALLWWYLIFATAVQNGYGTYAAASRCLWGHDYVCTLLISLCTVDHPLIPRSYWPELFWIGVALVAGTAGSTLWRRWFKQPRAE